MTPIRSGNQVDDLAGGLVDARQLAAIVTQVVEAEDALGLDNAASRQASASKPRPVAAGRGYLRSEAVLGGVVDDRADAPDPAARCPEFAEAGLPDPVAFGGRVVKDPAAQCGPGLAVGPEAARQQEPASTKGSLDRRSRHLEAIGAHHRADLAMTHAGQSLAYFAAGASAASTAGVGHGCAFDRFVTCAELGEAAPVGAFRVSGCRTGLRTSRPAAALLLSGPRGLRRDLVDVLRALLPDPQLCGRFGQCQLELLDLGALPPLDQAAAAAGPCPACHLSSPLCQRRTGCATG
jgi:hypothetical protein